jgi:hypothetical protein
LSVAAVATLLVSLASGELEVHSRTQGAELAIDGAARGTLPLTRPLLLLPGEHTIKISKRGYIDYLDVVFIRAGKSTRLDIDLLPATGILRLRGGPPGSRVFVDGKFVGELGQAPLEAEVGVGPRSVRVSKGGYRDFLGQVAAMAGQTAEVEVALVELPPAENPFRPPPPPRPKWYERWYVWAGGAAVVVAVTMAFVLPAALGGESSCQDYRGSICFDLRPGR